LRDKRPRSLHGDLAEINFPAKASNSKESTMIAFIATGDYGFFQPIHDIFKVHGYAGLIIFAVAFCLTSALLCKLLPSSRPGFMAPLLLCYVGFFSFEAIRAYEDRRVEARARHLCLIQQKEVDRHQKEVEYWQNRVTKCLRHSQARREQRSSPSEQ
jgi:hypothetical protein